MKLENQIAAMLWAKSYEMITLKKLPKSETDWPENKWLPYLTDIGFFPYNYDQYDHEHPLDLEEFMVVNDPCGLGRLALPKETAMKILVPGLP